MNTTELWFLFAAVGLATFLVRLSFIQFHARTDTLIQRYRHVLSLLPAVILAALCAPSLLFSRPIAEFSISAEQLAAATVTIVIARFSRSVLWPVAGGMLTLWMLNSIG
ncbi:AzlD domain-containing protein [Neptuniibacter halophilus]|uniref:AzlD domain-containing protein n=1 Tax=Neptuniibacter halophilus TaxID=651666 RepID=UPI0025724B77|nr:AzlD domain-containing protein [Neptuniibacter halophilus]